MATATKRHKIFISYRRDDAADAAGRIRDWLVQTKRVTREDVFMDVETILPGANFMQVIEQAIDQCKALIIVISPSWIAQVNAPNSYVRLEAEIALRRDVPVIPVLIGGVQMPPAGQLPPGLQKLTRLNARQVRADSFDYDMDWIRKALGFKVGAGVRWTAAVSVLLLVALSASILTQWPEGNPFSRVVHGGMATASVIATSTSIPTSAPIPTPTVAPSRIVEYNVPTPGGSPLQITSRSDGTLWFTEYKGHVIGRIMSNGAITELPIQGQAEVPTGITVWQGGVWFVTETGHAPMYCSASSCVGGLLYSESGGESYVTSLGDCLWFTGTNSNRIDTYFAGTTPKSCAASGSYFQYPVPTPKSVPVGIAAGADGNVWFTEFAGNKIGRLNPHSGVITEFPLPTADAHPRCITSGPDGSLWFTEHTGHKIGRITLAGTITEFPIPTPNSDPYDITAGPDGNLWFAEFSGNKIGRISPSTGQVVEFPVPTTDAQPCGITAGPDGNIWFTEYKSNKIGRLML